MDRMQVVVLSRVLLCYMLISLHHGYTFNERPFQSSDIGDRVSYVCHCITCMLRLLPFASTAIAISCSWVKVDNLVFPVHSWAEMKSNWNHRHAESRALNASLRGRGRDPRQASLEIEPTWKMCHQRATTTKTIHIVLKDPVLSNVRMRGLLLRSI